MTANGSRIAICGAGQMGKSVAVSFRRAGYQVLLWSLPTPESSTIERELESLEIWMDAHVAPSRLATGTIELVQDLAEVDRRADVVLDCIREDLTDKIDLFRRLPECLRRGALFLTATSGLSITELGRASGTSQLLAGTHFWNPPHLMPLVEVVRGQDTPDAVVDRTCELARSLGKTPVRVNRDVPGFIGNRLLHALWREAIWLVQEGVAAPEEVDLVARLTFGLRLAAVGPLENMDLVGLDLIQAIHKYLLDSLCDAHHPLPHLVAKVTQGQLGVKSGQGFYDWNRRDPAQLVERRDRQIVNQLQFLQELNHSA